MRRKEVIFQVVLNLVVFLFYAFDRESPGVETYRFAFFFNYAFAAFIINYVILPRYYRKKNLIEFIVLIALAIVASVLIEELILETIFFPNRAKSFKAFYAFLEIVPVITILSGVKFGWDALTKQREVDELKDAVRQSELQFLKSQINPHFLFNNLNNLYSYALEGSKKTPDIILELSGLLRYMLYDCQAEFVSLRKEVDQLENFINLNKLQIEDRGLVTFNSSGISDQKKIAPLILIVFVENAFKHSVGSLSEDIKIDIQLMVTEEGNLRFRCTNNYQDASNYNNVSNGIGLENVKKRLALIYPKNHKLDITKNKDEYIVDLEISQL